jgi:PD-(D/E)XK nuclease superfamily
VSGSYELPKGHLSFSQVRKYLTCPACYEAEYVHGVRPPISSALLIGIAAHAAVEDQRRAHLAGDSWDVARARTVAHDAVQEKLDEANGQGAGMGGLSEGCRSTTTAERVRTAQYAVQVGLDALSSDHALVRRSVC